MKKTVIITVTGLTLALGIQACGGGDSETITAVAEPSSPDSSLYALGAGSSTTVSPPEASDASALPAEGENLCGMGFCIASWVGDGHCDWACNCVETEFDGGDCGIFIDTGSTADGQEPEDVAVAIDVPAAEDEGPAADEGADTVEPPEDDGPQEDVSTELTFPCNEFIPCTAAWAGDGLCDQGCNCEEANWDGGDCPIPE